GACDDVEDIRVVPTPFTPACVGHPLAPITGPIEVRGAKPGDVVAIDLIELIPFGSGESAILRDFGVLRREFSEPMAVSSEVRDGRAWFGGRIPRVGCSTGMSAGAGPLMVLSVLAGGGGVVYRKIGGGASKPAAGAVAE